MLLAEPEGFGKVPPGQARDLISPASGTALSFPRIVSPKAGTQPCCFSPHPLPWRVSESFIYPPAAGWSSEAAVGVQTAHQGLVHAHSLICTQTLCKSHPKQLQGSPCPCWGSDPTQTALAKASPVPAANLQQVSPCMTRTGSQVLHLLHTQEDTKLLCKLKSD